MNLSRRELLAAGAASAASALPALPNTTEQSTQSKRAVPPAAQTLPASNLPIRDYLAREARRITDNALVDVKTPEEFNRRLPQRRRRFMEMMGLSDLPAANARGAVPFKVTGVVARATYRIEKIHYESLRNLHVTANFYVPKTATANERRPGILYVCGHVENQKVHYQGHPRRLAELGFPTLIVETVQLGEVTGYHHGCYREGWFHWHSRGYSPAAIELLNGIRGLDSRSIAAADERVKACSPVCGTAALAAHVYDRVVDGHCDCMWWINTALWDLTDVAALIAPRPLMIASANQDGIFPIDSIREVHARLQKLYQALDKNENLRLVETPGGHSYHERSRTAILSWFVKHLMGKDVAPAAVGDIELDESKLESLATLRVYVTGVPAGNRALTIQDEFIKLASPPAVEGAADIERIR